MSSVKVAVRVRPFNGREKERNAELIVNMNNKTTVLTRPAMLRVNPTAPPTPEDEKIFTFDHSYWSFDSNDSHFASQKTVFDDLGREVLSNAWEGFNCSIFAYGQTGSGKSYSMLGYGEDKGIIPLVCEEMFERINNTTTTASEQTVFKVEVSFMEIYNERVKDLLNPKNNKAGGLKVRNNPATGPYVEDLSKLAVKSFQEIDMLMDEGSKARTVASTNMNATSSRSHAVFTIVFTQSKIDKARGTAIDRVSKISLVDLAGSERAASTGATGVRLKEGANINKSLSTLGKVISALAENSTTKKNVFVPYRDSVLTYLLKESLGGNSKTIMIAAISPADINYEETLSTLRYADSAKKIKTVAVVNEDAQSKLIRELQAEVERLKLMMGNGGTAMPQDFKFMTGGQDQFDDNGLVLSLNEKIESYEKLMTELNKSWEEKLSEAEKVRVDRMAALKDMGVAIKVVSSIPHLVNLNEDPLMSESLLYYVKEGITRIGRSDSQIPQDIILNGLNIHKEHCILQNNNGVVTILPPPTPKEALDQSSPRSFIYVNGVEINSPTTLITGNRVILGNNHIFRYNNPEEAAKLAKERGSTSNTSFQSLNVQSEQADQIVDYDFALNELASIQGNLAMSKHINDKQEYKKQMKALYEQIRQQLEVDIDTETKEKREKLAILAIRRWRNKVFRSKLLNKISYIILALNEANAISETLQKNVNLSLKLFALYPEPEQISDSVDYDTDWRKTQVAIQVIKKDSGESTLISDQDFMDRIYSMRELYQNDGSLSDSGLDVDPFQVNFDQDTLIGLSHIYMKNILYLFDIKRPVPILDQNGSQIGYLNVSISSQSQSISLDDRNYFICSENSSHNHNGNGESQSGTSSPNSNSSDDHHNHSINGTTSKSYLIKNQPIQVHISIDGFTDFKAGSDEIFIRYLFNGEQYQSADYQSPQTFTYSNTIEIKQCNDEFLKYLQTQYLAIEVYGKKVSLTDSQSIDDQSLKQPLMETFEFLASLNIYESDGQQNDEYKPVHILEDPYASNANVPSVTFRLKKEKTQRQIQLKFLKSDENTQSQKQQRSLQKPNQQHITQQIQPEIKDCRSAKITNIRIIGKKRETSGFVPSTSSSSQGVPNLPKSTSIIDLSANANTPSTPSNPRSININTPSTPMTPYSTSLGNSSLQSTPNNASSTNLSLLKEVLTNSTPGANNNNPSQSINNTPSQNQSNVINQISDEIIELPIIDYSNDSVLLSWRTIDPTILLNQNTRKGDKIIFTLLFEVSINGFPDYVTISKDISVKILSSDSLVNVTEGSNTSMSNLLDRFKTHFKGRESILGSEPSISAGAVFNVYLTKSRQLEHQYRIGEMIDLHQENIIKLGYSMKMEKLRQELDLREKINIVHEKQQHSDGSGSGDQLTQHSHTETGTSNLNIEEIVKKMSMMNNISSQKRKQQDTQRKRSSTIIEVKVKEVASSALLKEDEMSGYLKKKSAFKEDWKPRWFVFKRPYLYISHSEKEGAQKQKKIDLTNSSVAPQEDVPFGFAIILLRRVWLLQASTNDEREKWMQMLDPLRKVTELKNEEIRSAKQQIEKSSSQLDQIKSQLQLGQQVVLAKQKEIEDLTNSISQLQLEKEFIQQQMESFRDDINMRDEEINTLRETQNELMQRLSGQVQDLQVSNDNKEVQIGSLSNTLSSTNQLIEHMNQQAKSYKDVKDMQVEQLAKETLTLRENLEKFTEKLTECKITMEQMEKQAVEKDSTIKDLSQKLSFKEQDSSLKQNQIDILSKTVEQSSVAMKEISHQYSTTTQVNEKQIQVKEEEIDTINSAYQNESNKLKDQTNQLTLLTQTLRGQMKTMEQSNQTQKESSQQDQKRLLLLLQDLESGLGKASQTITEQSHQNMLLKKELEESKKLKDQSQALEKQIHLFKQRLVQSEDKLIDRECENTILSDKLKLWEEEIKIKDSKLALLENNVKEVRAEYANGMAFSREFSNQADHASAGKNSRKSKALTTEEQIESMRESSIAHQTHNAFLNLQIQRLENENRQQEKVYSETIQRIKKDLQQRNQQNIAFMKQQAGEEVVKKMEDQISNIDQLKKKYFVSLVVSAKLQNVMMGNMCNVDAYEMYEHAVEQHILDENQWPGWISENINKNHSNQ
ncbi:kinesin-3 [Tieghemostelium lacteum]|uniref:Kinesin-3 n=1 Tax=Tieghemostelium lacteum TaxID=361077 RepID=A0A152A2L1_TIELA|nr:kinesin-3 [Tieghemostelium lacteum]|eukprot:KYR00493.1 kinesin-3 [Tieghemostelium lacteum]